MTLLKKRKYLYRLAVSIFGILLVPMMLFMFFFLGQSYKRLMDSTDQYYEELTKSYKSVLDKKLTGLKEHATGISVKSRNADSLFWEKPDDFPDENYWYYNIVNELQKEYGNCDVSAIGIYYYDDMIIRNSGTLRLEQYTRVLDTADEDSLREFFSKETHTRQGMKFMVNSSEKLLVGVCVDMGYSKQNALIFYELSGNDIEEIVGNFYQESGFTCYLMDTVHENRTFVIGNTDATEVKGYEYFTDEGYDFYILAGYLNEAAPQSQAVRFFHEMVIGLSVMVVVLLGSYVLILYIAYKPVYHITAQLEEADEADEFELINKVIADGNSKMSEQEMLILDFILDHLLYGISISKNKLRHLGIGENIRYYCVFMLEGYVLTSVQERELVTVALERFHAKLFVTDWQGEAQSVCIFFMEEKNTEDLRKMLLELCRKNQISEGMLYGGKLVSSLNEINVSMQYCLKRAKGANTDTDDDKNRGQKREELKQNILNYIDVHYLEAELSQEGVADHFKISTYTLSRLFRNQVGVGFVEYVNAKRIEYAKEQLLLTSDSVHSIAEKSGFFSDNNFYKVFKAYTGVSPSAFRSGGGTAE